MEQEKQNQKEEPKKVTKIVDPGWSRDTESDNEFDIEETDAVRMYEKYELNPAICGVKRKVKTTKVLRGRNEILVLKATFTFDKLPGVFNKEIDLRSPADRQYIEHKGVGKEYWSEFGTFIGRKSGKPCHGIIIYLTAEDTIHYALTFGDFRVLEDQPTKWARKRPEVV